MARLVAGSRDRRLTLLWAPAGSGKTVLLSEWHASAEETRPFAWVSLDPDDEPLRFWSYVLAALGAVDPAMVRRAQAALPVRGFAAEHLLPPLLNDIASSRRRLVLVLDDYHFVRDERIHQSVSLFLRRLQDTLHLAIASANPTVDEKVRRELLTAWLNLVSGREPAAQKIDLKSVPAWPAVVTDTNGSSVTTALNLVRESEPARAEPVEHGAPTRPSAAGPAAEGSPITLR